LKRGDIVPVAWSGDYGKPRPAVVIQADRLTESEIDSVLVCQITSDLQPASIRRITVIPTPENGLRKPSQIMAEKIFAAKRMKCGAVMGAMDDASMDALGDAVMFAVGLMG
jgi:mRNA interferase MazF